MAEIFQCPSCSGRLEFDGGDHATVRCSYCGNTVIVPQSLRSRSRNASRLYEQQGAVEEIVRLINAGNRQQAVQLYAKTFDVERTQAREAVARLADGLSLSAQHVNVQLDGSTISTIRRVGCLIAVSVLLITVGTAVIPLVAGGAAIWSVFSQEPVATGVAEVLEEGAPQALAEEAAYASLVDSFGSEGIAPAQFVDPRAIAIAPDGEIFVADYSSGRVQRFDAQGNYLGLWQWDEERVIQALAVSTQDDLYAVQGGNLVRFSRESGEAQGTLTYESDVPISFRDVAVAPNGDIVALNHFHEYVRFDATGAVLHVVDIEEATEVSGVNGLALDGLGNVYVLATYQDVLEGRQFGIFLFSNEGRFRSRFGSSGDEPGQFTSPGTVAVDGQGRIYVSDFPGIITFSNSGSYLGTTDTEGVIFGIALNSDGEMIATGNANKVFRFAAPAP